ncbi:unnamed protein product, partial [Oppiella nova]
SDTKITQNQPSSERVVNEKENLSVESSKYGSNKSDVSLDKQESDESVVDRSGETEPKVQKPVIKGRKILRKADRNREERAHEEPDVCEDKEVEVLNKLSELEISSVEEKAIQSSDSLISEMIESDVKSEEPKSEETAVEGSDEKECRVEKTVIKGRKLIRKVDRSRVETTPEESNVFDEKKTEVLSKLSECEVSSAEEKVIESSDSPMSATIKSDLKCSEPQSDATTGEGSDASETKDNKNIIKGRKLIRKADRLREQTTHEESEVSEEKKAEVLSKLSEVNPTNKWNNWFSDIKSAAMTATSTTVNHMSNASNKWSFDTKSLLSGAVTITSTVGTGLNSIVDNVSSVVDTAIGVPPPEQMAALVTQDMDSETNTRLGGPSQQPNEVTNESSSESSFRSLFDSFSGKKTTGAVIPNISDFDKRK